MGPRDAVDIRMRVCAACETIYLPVCLSVYACIYIYIYIYIVLFVDCRDVDVHVFGHRHQQLCFKLWNS